jgi:uncharacterized protein (TIGR03118 family)
MTRSVQERLRQTVIALLGMLMVAVVPSLYAGGRFYQQRNLVSDGFMPAEEIDPNLVNPWGIAFNPDGFVWVANNGTGVATLYDGNGSLQSSIIKIPPVPGSSDPGNPTGIVFNGSTDFVIRKGANSGPSRFIFASENGTIAAWARKVDPTKALLVIDNSKSEAIYKGLALAANGTDIFLYATDFHHGKSTSSTTPFSLPRRRVLLAIQISQVDLRPSASATSTATFM